MEERDVRVGAVTKVACLCALAIPLLGGAAQTDDQGLPPGHPKLDRSASPPALSSEAGDLPPGHPKIDALPSGAPSGESKADLPPGHPQVRPGNAPPTAEQILKQLDSTPDLKKREKTFEVASALGKLYYSHARYAEAAEYLGQATQKAEPARALYLQRRQRAAGSASAKEGACGSLAQNSLEAQTAAARQLSQKGDSAGALSCLRAALEPELEVEELRANALFLTGNSSAALAGFERALAISGERVNCLYGRASVLFDSRGDDLKSLKQVKEDLTHVLRLVPTGEKADYVRKLLARTEEAISSGGITKLIQKNDAEHKAAPTRVAARPPAPAANQQLPPLSPDVVESIKNTERTPELQAGLAKLVEEGEDHLAHGKYQDALDAYKRVVPFEPDNGRAKAGMAWAMVGLQRQPMADRVWSVAVSGDPAAVDKLGDALAAKGDKAGAKALWKKLAETAPTYAKSSGLSAKLK
jgi:tetratricopeptide (TPR) repeat protein